RGWRWRDSRAGAPGAERVVGQIGAFLILVGLAALAVGGVGVGASARAFLDSKVETIATLKTLGADGATVMRVYLLQIGALAAVGVAIGVAVGGVAPLALAPLLAESLPAPTRFGLYAEPLIEAALFGLAVAFLFALWPLARARQVRAAGLFRDLVAPTQAHPGWDVLIAIGALAAFLAAAAAVFTGAKTLSLGFVGGVAAALALLTLAAQGVAWIARRLARTRAARGRLALRLALSSVGGAGGSAAETRSAVLALGLGLTVLTAIGLVDVNLRRFVTDQLPATAPAYFFVDIQNADLERFVAQAEAQPGVERIETAPMLRGVITRINGVSSSDWLASGRGSQDFEWVLRGDRGVTYAAEPPQGTQIVDGDWWPADYSGAPQVSFGAEQAQGLGLRLGDEITVNVFGRDITAEITSFRKVEFRSGGINFLMVFDPGVLRGAPHAHIATIYGEEPSPGLYLRELARAFPTVTAVRSAEFLARVEQVLRDLAAAARAGAAVTLITGLVVLLGAAAASQRRQIYEAAILKTLGASRGALIAGLALRAAMFGAAAGVVAIGAGALGAWAVITFVLDGRFQFDAATAAFVVLAGVFATLAASAAFAYGPLSARPARVLRSRE
ncbi:MAG: FtsX-like permease family protein, partial [Pseudomonadota bacterium]